MKKNLFSLTVAACFFLASMSFALNRYENTYCFLRYEVLGKDNKTYYLVVSDVISYDNWVENQSEMRKKFKEKAEVRTSFEVSDASIQADGTSKDKDEVLASQRKYVKLFTDYRNDNTKGTKAQTYTIYLNL